MFCCVIYLKLQRIIKNQESCMMFRRQEGDLKQWSVTVKHKTCFFFSSVSFKFKTDFWIQIENQGLGSAQANFSTCLHLDQAVSVLPNYAPHSLEGFLKKNEQFTTLTQSQIWQWFLQKCSRQKSWDTYSQQPSFILSRTGHWYCKSLKYSKGYHRAKGNMIILCFIMANATYMTFEIEPHY